ncbi:hypothetical protein MTR67_018991 [Solanum verrucosum]|uniref:Uncharacterized protein n=1 Tax=Solanum verrucosum TaxID=315347 RepID=A0AAF0QLR3_SOLVR|nr:hypothetical protein MTR67_018991 [Solanum verrucosum]
MFILNYQLKAPSLCFDVLIVFASKEITSNNSRLCKHGQCSTSLFKPYATFSRFTNRNTKITNYQMLMPINRCFQQIVIVLHIPL